MKSLLRNLTTFFSVLACAGEAHNPTYAASAPCIGGSMCAYYATNEALLPNVDACPSGLITGPNPVYTGMWLEPGTTSATISYMGDTCHYILKNTTTVGVFMPFCTKAEWDAFILHLPTGITTTACATPP